MFLDTNLNQISKSLFSLSSFLTEPICKAHEKLYSKVLLKDDGRLYPKGTVLSKASKIYNLTQSIFLAVIGVPLAAVGFVVRFVAMRINPENFLYYYENAEELPEPEDSIELIAHNICAIAGGYPTIQSGLKPYSERIDSIIDNIKKENKPLVVLEEVYDHKCAQRLKEKLHGYSHFVVNTGPVFYGAPMGLFIASKYKIDRPKFSYFSSNTNLGNTKFIGKGLFSCYIGKTLFLLSHLQHSKKHNAPSDDEKTARRQQIESIRDFIQSEKKKDSDIRVVLLGDLNLNLKKEKANLFDIFQKPSQNQITYFPTKKIFNKEKVSESDGSIIDHILLEKDKGEVAVEIREAFDIDQDTTADFSSDHQPLVGLLTFNEKA